MANIISKTFGFKLVNNGDMLNTGFALTPSACRIVRGPFNANRIADPFFPIGGIDPFFEVKVGPVNWFVLAKFVTP
jgi:hypothetical protein